MKIAPPPPPRIIRLETPNHIIRTVERGDACESWTNWLLDPLTAQRLNARPAKLSMEALHAYIDRFDRSTKHLLGIFEKDSGRLVEVEQRFCGEIELGDELQDRSEVALDRFPN